MVWMVVMVGVHSSTLHVPGESRLYGAAELGPIVLKEWVDARGRHRPGPSCFIEMEASAHRSYKQQRLAVGSSRHVENFPRANEIRSSKTFGATCGTLEFRDKVIVLATMITPQLYGQGKVETHALMALGIVAIGPRHHLAIDWCADGSE